MRADRSKAYEVLDRHQLKGYSRLTAMRLFDSLRSAHRRLKGRNLYNFIMMTVKEINYKILDDRLIDELVDLEIPIFKSLRGRFKGKG